MSSIADVVSQPYLLTRGFTGRAFHTITPAEVVTNEPPPLVVEAPPTTPPPGVRVGTVYTDILPGLGGYSRRNQDVVVDIVFEGQGASLLTFQYLQPYFDQLIAAVQLDFALAIQPSATGLPMLSVIKTTTVHFTQFRPNPATALIQRAGGSLAPLMRDKVKARFKFKAGAQMADSEVVTESVLWARVSIGQLELAYGGTALLVRMYQTDPISG